MAITVAHFSNFCPHSNGMFFTVKDLILGERTAGINAEFVDWGGKKEHGQSINRVGLSYGGITTKSVDWAMQNADVIVLHSALPKEVENSGKPIIVAMHGRPEYSFELERIGRGTCIGVYKKFNKMPQCKGFICFWKEHIPIWETILEGRKITHVPAMVNLNDFTPEGNKFGFKDRGAFNIIATDVWREDITPFNVVMAAASFIKNSGVDAKLHIFGLSEPNKTSAFGNILNPLKRQGIIGECRGLLRQIDEIYRDADLLVTPHVIATRVIREATASGLPMVGGTGNQYTPFIANPMDVGAFSKEIELAYKVIQADPKKFSIECRKVAEREFNLSNAGEAMKELVDQVCPVTTTTKVQAHRVSKPKSMECKVLVTKPDYTIHNFVAYCPGFAGKDLGGTYNKYMELIPDNDWACFIDHDAMFTTRNWYDQLYAIIQCNKEYSCFTAITNRVGNPEQRIATLNQDCHDILQHRSLGRKIQNSFMTTVADITDRHRMSGVVMLIKKSAWKDVGGFEKGFLGVDNGLHIRLAKAGHKVGLAKGLYVYHVYRADGQSDLKPVEN